MFNKKDRIEIVDFAKEAKRREQKKAFQRKVNDVKNAIYDNKELIMFVGPTIVGGMTFGIKNLNKHIKLRKEKDLKE